MTLNTHAIYVCAYVERLQDGLMHFRMRRRKHALALYFINMQRRACEGRRRERERGGGLHNAGDLKARAPRT